MRRRIDLSVRHLVLAGVVASTGCSPAPTDVAARVPGAVHGRVVLEGIAPVPEATIELRRPDVVERAVSDAEGAFAFPRVAPGAWDVLIYPPAGYRTAPEQANPLALEVPPRGQVDLQVVLANGPATGSIAVQVLADSAVGGRVTALPVGGVLVQVVGPGALDVLRGQRTGDGGFAVFSVVPGAYRVDLVPPDDWDPAPGTPDRIDDVAVQPGVTRTLEFRITPNEAGPGPAGVSVRG